MSGGHFDYVQYRINDIVSDLELELSDPEHSQYVKSIIRDGIEVLERAFVYAHRLDWYFSGDDGEESLVTRLKEDLERLKGRR